MEENFINTIKYKITKLTMKKLKIVEQNTHYAAIRMSQSDYDELRVVRDKNGRITIRFTDVRWRSIEETQELLREMADLLEQFKP